MWRKMKYVKRCSFENVKQKRGRHRSKNEALGQQARCIFIHCCCSLVSVLFQCQKCMYVCLGRTSLSLYQSFRVYFLLHSGTHICRIIFRLSNPNICEIQKKKQNACDFYVSFQQQQQHREKNIIINVGGIKLIIFLDNEREEYILYIQFRCCCCYVLYKKTIIIYLFYVEFK